jgi:outer membrane protein OmpA-like peptidoglycan-associated protein
MIFKKFLFVLISLAISVSLSAQKNKPVYKKTVYFDFNKWEIREQDKKNLSLMLKAIKAQKQPYYLSIIGHTDNIDNNKYNYQLGLKRAEAVAQYLMKRGADSSLMKLYSKGEEQKAVANTTDSLRLLNRRVEILLFRKTTPINTGTTSVDSSIQITLKGSMFDSASGEPLLGQILLFKKTLKGDNRLINSFLNTSTFTINLYKGEYEISFASKGYKTKNISYSLNGNSFIKNETIHIKEKLRKIKIKRKVSFDKIHFYGNQAKFLPSAGPHLREVLRLAKSKDIAAIEIVGHVNYPYHYNQNDTNMIKYNFQLSFNRAKAVYNYLVDNGINGDIITYKGVSNTEMLYPNAIREQEMSKNRRVEVLILEESTN